MVSVRSASGPLDFGRTLSATTAFVPLLDSLNDRLVQVLNVEKVAIFIEDPKDESRYTIARSTGLSAAYNIPPDFKQMIRQKSAISGVVRADELAQADIENTEANGNGKRPAPQELHYFVPCVTRSKMVAVIVLGRAKYGSLLSSEDLDILRTVSGYIALRSITVVFIRNRNSRRRNSRAKELTESISNRSMSDFSRSMSSGDNTLQHDL